MAACRAQVVHRGALVVANPPPATCQLDLVVHDGALAEGLAGVQHDNITGKAITPYLLAHFHERTTGASLTLNIAVLVRNAALAAQIAAAYHASA